MRKALLLLLFLSVYLPSKAQTILNKYAKVVEIAPCNVCLQNCKDITVDNASEFNVGDVIMIIQMKGATISLNADTTFGSVLDYGSAGYHEQNKIEAIAGTTITLETGLQANYDVNGSLQIVSVPQYTDYTVTEKIIGKPWDGNSGGVIAFDVSGTLTLQDSIDATGLGFRGAFNPNQNFDEVFCGMKDKGDWYFPYADLQVAGMKGEGIANEIEGYELGRGAWANGGGGGHNHNAGGGGGSNVGHGGQGGHEFGDLYCGSVKNIRNGIGGTKLERDGGLRMFLGGGGGAGQENNHRGNSGGAGGGIIIISAGKIEGNGNTINSTGLIGYNYDGIQNAPGGNDGGGGGGAGGSIKLNIPDFGTTPLTLNADGADGGSLTVSIHGPGGGGGGGLICSTVSSFPANINTSVKGGKGGVTNYNTPASWDNWGTTDGEAGEVALSCTPPKFPPLKIQVNLGPDVILCTPPSKTLDTRIDPGMSFQWFKDGAVINEAEGPSYLATGPGEYVVKVGGNGCPESYDTVLVTSNNPTPKDSLFCEEQSVRLSISGAGSYAWYDSPTSETKLGNGLFFDTPTLSETTVYYVEDTSIFNHITGAPATGHGFTGGGSRGVDNDQKWDYLTFDAFNDFRLDALKVQFFGYYCPPASTFTVKVNIYDVNGTLVGTATDTPPCAVGTPTAPIRVNVGIDIPKGNGYYLTLDGSKDGQNAEAQIMWYDNGANFPYNIPDVISIFSVHNEFVGEIDASGVFQPGWAPKSHPAVYDWEISSGTLCGRVPVQAIKFCSDICTPPSQLEIAEDTIKLCNGHQLDVTPAVNYGTNPASDYLTTWIKNNDTLPSAGNNYSIPFAAMADTGWYKIRVRHLKATSPDCYIEDSVYVIVYSNLTAGTIVSNESICEGTISGLLTESAPASGALAPYSYQWQLSTDSLSWTDITTDGKNKSYQPTALNSTTWFRRLVTSSEGCGVDTTLPVKVTVLSNLAPFVSLTLSPKDTVCENSEITFTASGNGSSSATYEWKVGGVTEQTGTSETFTFTFTSSRTVSVTLDPQSTCATGKADADTVIVVQKNPDQPDIDQNNFSVCSDTTTLTSNTLLSEALTWSVRSTDQATVAVTSSIPPAIKVSDMEANKISRIYLTASTGPACPVKTDSVDIESLTIPVVSAQSGFNLCSSENNIEVTGNIPGAGETSGWQDMAGILISTGTDLIIPSLTPGSHSFVYKVSNAACSATDTTILIVDEPAVNNGFSKDTISTCNDSENLNALSIAPASSVGSWTVLSGPAVLKPGDENMPDAEVSGLSTGLNAFEWSVSNGSCPAVTDTVYINKLGSLSNATISISGGKYNSTDITNGSADLCLENSYQITGSGFASDENGFWKITGTDNSLTINENSNLTQPLILNTYGINQIAWIINKNLGGCPADSAYAIIKIFTTPDPAGTISGPAEVCEGEIADLSIASVPGADNYTWEVVSGDAVISNQDGTENASIIFNGSNSIIRVIPENGCGITDTATIDILVNPNLTPAISVSADKNPICQGETIVFTPALQNPGLNPVIKWYVQGSIVHTGPDFSWDGFSDGDKVSAELYPDLTCVDSTVLNGKGAVASTEIEIEVNEPKEVKVSIASLESLPVCADSTLHFTASGINEGSTPVYNWYLNSDPSPVASGPSYSSVLNNKDTVKVRLSVTETCIVKSPVSDSVIIELLPLKTIFLNLTGPADVCQNNSITFEAIASDSASANLIWYLNGIEKERNTSSFEIPTSLAPGNHEVSVKVISDYICITNQNKEAEETVPFSVHALPDSSVTGSPYFCPEKSTVLSAQPGYSNYEWSTSDGIVNAGNGTDKLEINSNGSYFVKITTDKGCVSTSDPIQVSEVETGSAQILSSAGNTICSDDSTHLTVTESADQYAWFFNQSDLNYYSSGLTANQQGQYWAVLFYGSCADTVKYELQVVPAPTPEFENNEAIICETDTYTIISVTSGGNVKWYKDGTALSNTSPSLTTNQSGTYIIEEDNGVCIRSSPSFLLATETVPHVFAGHDISIFQGESAQLEASGASWYEWKPETTMDNPFVAAPVANPDSSVTTYVVRGFSAGHLCSATDTVIVSIEMSVKPWNSFSPNGDGVHDYWIIEDIENYPGALVEVYNRWGNLVWQSRGYNSSSKAWRGENFRNGELLPVATYYYVIHPNGNRIDQPLSGHVTIVR